MYGRGWLMQQQETIYLANCLIVDGTGAPMTPGSVLIKDGRIVALGGPAPEGARVIDCADRIVAPGFIDAHSHNDWFCLRPDSDKYFKPFIQQGITSFVTGNCGFSAAGYEKDSAYIDEIGGGLFTLDEASKPFAAFADFLCAVDEKSPVNIAMLAGHGTARIGANGKGPQPLDAKRFDQMMQSLESALQNGAPGVSWGLMYEPGIFAPREELLAVARLVKKYDKILTVHPKAQSAVSLSYPLLAGSHLLLALKELTDIVRETGVRFQYSHLLFVGERTWKDEQKALAGLHQLNTDGFDAMFDMYPLNYGASVITVVLPKWYMEMSFAQRAQPLTKLKLYAMITATTKLLGFGFADITIACGGEKHPEMGGKSIPQLAKMWGISNFAAYLRVCEETDFKATVLQGRFQNREIVKRLMQNDLSLFMTDAWVTDAGKQNGGIYGAFPMFLELAKEAGIPLEKAIAKMTGDTAHRFRLQGRGVLRPGAFADVVVFDPNTIQSRIEQELPPLGIHHVFINGQQVIANGVYAPVPGAGQAMRG